MNRTGRFAPSPTGRLHLGNLRTALLAWLLARSQGARFLLRVEDLDRERSRPEHVAGQLEDLRALGLDWDEQLPPQSGRGPAYEAAIGRLRERDLLYECFCTRREIRAAASAPNGELPGGAYPGTCQELSAAERRSRRASRAPALRVRAQGARIELYDRVAGAYSGAVDDFVVRRGDGQHAYNLAVAVDDAEQGIGEVARGRDLLPSTPRQIWLRRQLGLPEGESWAHLPLLLGAGRRRLAKRDGAVTLPERLRLGESATEVRAILASSAGLCEAGERPSLVELLQLFDPARLPAAEATLEWPQRPESASAAQPG